MTAYRIAEELEHLDGNPSNALLGNLRLRRRPVEAPPGDGLGSLALHRAAEAAMDEAEQFLRYGPPGRAVAARVYAEAAALEEAALTQIPADLERTRAIIAESARALRETAAALAAPPAEGDGTR